MADEWIYRDKEAQSNEEEDIQAEDRYRLVDVVLKQRRYGRLVCGSRNVILG